MTAKQEKLVVDHMPLARKVAWKHLRASVPHGLMHSDLLSAAYFGLVDAAKRWRAGGGASFGTFAWQRMHGALIDQYRAWDPNARRCHDKRGPARMRKCSYDAMMEHVNDGRVGRRITNPIQERFCTLDRAKPDRGLRYVDDVDELGHLMAGVAEKDRVFLLRWASGELLRDLAAERGVTISCESLRKTRILNRLKRRAADANYGMAH